MRNPTWHSSLLQPPQGGTASGSGGKAAVYKKGVDALEKHGMEALQASMPRIMVSGTSKNVSAIDKSELQRFYERKLEYYKKLYTVLPRGYFKQ